MIEKYEEFVAALSMLDYKESSHTYALWYKHVEHVENGRVVRRLQVYLHQWDFEIREKGDLDYIMTQHYGNSRWCQVDSYERAFEMILEGENDGT